MTKPRLPLILCLGAVLLVILGLAAQAAPDPHPVIEYGIVEGRRDTMIAPFERHFVESQEAGGARPIGRYRAIGDPDRFTWIRDFVSMEARQILLLWRPPRALLR